MEASQNLFLHSTRFWFCNMLPPIPTGHVSSSSYRILSFLKNNLHRNMAKEAVKCNRVGDLALKIWFGQTTRKHRYYFGWPSALQYLSFLQVWNWLSRYGPMVIKYFHFLPHYSLSHLPNFSKMKTVWRILLQFLIILPQNDFQDKN